MMAYPFYQGYQPYPQFGQITQQMPQQMQATQMSPASTDDRIFVQGRGAAEAYLVAPNSFVRLWDSQKNVFYEKRADQTGRPYMETYEYHIQQTANAPQGTIDYDSKIKALEERISALEGGVHHDEQ